MEPALFSGMVRVTGGDAPIRNIGFYFPACAQTPVEALSLSDTLVTSGMNNPSLRKPIHPDETPSLD